MFGLFLISKHFQKLIVFHKNPEIMSSTELNEMSPTTSCPSINAEVCLPILEATRSVLPGAGRLVLLLLELAFGRRRRRFRSATTHWFMRTCEATASYGGASVANLSTHATPRKGCVSLRSVPSGAVSLARRAAQAFACLY